MDPTDHVTRLDPADNFTSRELSQKLAEAGVPQESLFVRLLIYNSWADTHQWRLVRRSEVEDMLDPIYVAAYTASELGAMLPYSVTINGHDCRLRIDKHERRWNAYYTTGYYAPGTLMQATADTEANARARLLLKLIEAGHVSFTDEKEHA